jgi:hypothetical protein
MFKGFFLKGIKLLVSNKRLVNMLSCIFHRLVFKLGGLLNIAFGIVGVGGYTRPARLVDLFSKAAINSYLILNNIILRMFLLRGYE